MYDYLKAIDWIRHAEKELAPQLVQTDDDDDDRDYGEDDDDRDYGEDDDDDQTGQNMPSMGLLLSWSRLGREY